MFCILYRHIFVGKLLSSQKIQTDSTINEWNDLVYENHQCNEVIKQQNVLLEEKEKLIQKEKEAKEEIMRKYIKLLEMRVGVSE